VQSTRTASVEFVTGNYFDVLGVTPALGRLLRTSDQTAPSANPVVVIGHGLWQRDYGVDTGILGRTIEVNRYPLTIVGVAAEGFHGTIPLYDNELFIPITMAADVCVIDIAGVRPGAGHLRPGRVNGPPAHTGNRHSHGAGCDRAAGAARVGWE
jgi:hypothetical protein